MPNDTKQPNTSGQTPTNNDLPPVMMEDTAPPMMNDGPQTPVVTTTQTTTTTVQDTPTDSGSAAPSDDIVMPPVITTQKKKFAGGKVIATILGLFLLVGGLGAGIFLVGQNQNIEEQAGCYSTCMNQIGDTDECDYACQESGQSGDNSGYPDNPGCGCGVNAQGECKDCGPGVDDGNDGGGGSVTPPTGGSLGSLCDGPTDVGLAACGSGLVCTGNPGGSTCTLASNVIIPAGVTRCDGDTQGVPESIGVCCSTGGTSYNYETGGSFTGDHWTTCASGYTCQQDYGCVESSGGGGDNTPPEDTPPPGGTPPAITAQCQNVKAYSPTWTLLTTTQLSQLETGDSVNFCVTGVATGGSFDRARFTINGVLQPETTAVRPTSTDFCQLYTIPATTTTFNITAQIHHVSLGWK